MKKGSILTHNLGYPRIGEQRQLKKATEAYWKGQISRTDLIETGRKLRRQNWLKQKAAGIDWIPCNDFSFYDQVLDTTCLLGNVPPRFGWKGGAVDLDLQFEIARGVSSRGKSSNEMLREAAHGRSQEAIGFASEMTKWFDTNYHYIVPEFNEGSEFALATSKIFDEFAEAQSLGILAKPVVIGPMTYLALGKVHDAKCPDFNRFSLMARLLPAYEEIIRRLAKAGAEWIQLDEPVLALDLGKAQQELMKSAYQRLNVVSDRVKLLVTTYFGELRESIDLFTRLSVAAVHFDAVRGDGEVDKLLGQFPDDKVLSLGVVDGRNIWKNDYAASLTVLRKASAALGEDRLWIAPSCSLQHVPVTLEGERTLDLQLKSWFAFADEKLREVAVLRDLLEGREDSDLLEQNGADQQSRRNSTRIHNPAVKARLSSVRHSDFQRASTFVSRQRQQRAKLRLPLFPTTTIGSFPQTAEVRSARAKWKKGELSHDAYEAFLKREIDQCIQFQEEVGMDMLVHGEFERNDMVEYFGEQLEGFTFTENGWVQSYGSRYVKPPIIFGDVRRPKPMTIYWSEYAQQQTHKPMKGMLTGPITLLQWSFVRNDQPRSETAMQIALGIRDEVADLEKAGIAAIQIDEPAIREGLPLRQSDWSSYLDWAVKAFRLCSSGVKDKTQIHTHMCYAEFNDIIKAIAELDADVITIETSRSNLELLNAFVAFRYPNEIGPGVYDIHSPRVPSVSEMVDLMRKAESVIPRESLWVNPDCGLKTRSWAEVKRALGNMVEAAYVLRREDREGESTAG